MKKKVNVLLAAVVLGLWGTVMYRYVNRFFYSEEVAAFRETSLSANLPDTMKKDTFELRPLSNDPFLHRRVAPKAVRTRTIASYTPKPIVKPQPPKPKMITPFPVVKYFGFIKSQDKKEELILMKINNTLHKTRLNGNCDGVTVKKIYKDSVQVVFGKETRIIKK